MGGQVFIYSFRHRCDAQIHRIVLVCTVSSSESLLTASADSQERSVGGECQRGGARTG